MNKIRFFGWVALGVIIVCCFFSVKLAIKPIRGNRAKHNIETTLNTQPQIHLKFSVGDTILFNYSDDYGLIQGVISDTGEFNNAFFVKREDDSYSWIMLHNIKDRIGASNGNR
jgi:hypothetical protein